MSLILDALNRSRDDANPVPGLATHHFVESVSAERRQYLLWVALAIAVVLIAWLVLEKYGPSPSQSPLPLEEIVVPEAKPAAVSVPPQQDATESSAVISTPESTGPALADASSLDGFFMEGCQDLPAEQGTAVPSPTSSRIRNDAVAKLYQNPELLDERVRAKPADQPFAPSSSERMNPDAAGAQAAGDNIDIDQILRMAREESENTGLRDHSVPFLIDLSQQIKDSIPTVYYLRHDYSSDTARSSVVLNSKTLNVGGTPASGMKIEEILRDSVVLNYQGTQFRLRALNSWVNL